jgi:hypothetical protein
MPKDLIPDGAITENHIKYILAKFHKINHQNNYDIMSDKLTHIKKELRQYASLVINRAILDHCHEVDLRYGSQNKRVKNFRDLKEFYCNNYTDDDAEKVWTIIIGKFISCRKFFSLQGDAYMESKKWKYAETENDLNMRSGFATTYVYRMRGERQRLLNFTVAKLHKRKLHMSRSPNMKFWDTSKGENIKGKFYSWMVDPLVSV